MTDDQAHRAALGAVLADPSNAGLILDQLTADDFDPGWMQTTFTAIAEVHAAGLNPSATALVAHLQSTGRLSRNDGGIGPFIAELYEAATFPLDPQQHINAVIETSYRRQVWAATTRIRQACTEWSLPAVLATVDRELTEALQASARLAVPTATGKSSPDAVRGIPGLMEILNGLPENPAA